MMFIWMIARFFRTILLLICIADLPDVEAAVRHKLESYETIGEYSLPEMTPQVMERVCAERSLTITAGWSDAPFMVSIRNIGVDRKAYGRGHLCGGTIISPYLVLTAASCTRAIPVEQMGVVIGTLARKKTAANTTQLNLVTAVLEHPSFSEDRERFDIAMVFLRRSAPLGVLVRPARLSSEDPKPGQDCAIYGWGSDDVAGVPECLRKAVVAVEDQKGCVQRAAGMGLQIPVDAVCVAPAVERNGDCSVDVGGPLVCNGVVHGIATTRVDCEDRERPTYYTGVARYRYWIQQTIHGRLRDIIKQYPKNSFDVRF